MQYFLGPEVDGEQTRETDHYQEITTQIDGASIVSYVISVDGAHTFAACTCFEQRFDEVLKQLNDPRLGPIFLVEFRRVWPSFFIAYDNAAGGQYGKGALAEFVDPDDMNRKWLIASMFTAFDDDQMTERMGTAMVKAINLSVDVHVEFSKKLTAWQMARAAAKGAAVGYRTGRAQIEPWEKGLDWLRVLSGQQ